MFLWALGLAIRHWALVGISGVLLRILGGEGGGGRGVLPGSPNPDPSSDQEIPIFHTRFQTWPLKSITRPLRNDIIITLERQQNIFLKIHFEFASDFSCFLVHLELKR